MEAIKAARGGPPREMSKSRGPSQAGNYGPSSYRTSAPAPGGAKQYPPITAKIKGPGSGKYGRQPCTGIRNHDFTMFAEPAYTMRIKHSEKMLADTVSPDAYFVDPHLSRFGWWTPPSFRMQNREKSLGLMIMPAPNAYHPEMVHPQGEPNAPAYSLADRTRFRENDPNPAANAYTLPGMLGPGLPIKPSAPCYSMASKVDSALLARGPGPAAFTVPEPNVYLHRQPAYSMWRKHTSVRDSTPGPADYETSRITVTKPRAPDFSLGIRHSEYLSPLVIDVME
ncbi:protein CIMAP1C [Pelodiscus sinensis]|uniref:protein CIMAP1C n=1 Tax=Pelodiscus sinensis TaxID=13735 RepID=UPI003F6B8BE6